MCSIIVKIFCKVTSQNSGGSSKMLDTGDIKTICEDHTPAYFKDSSKRDDIGVVSCPAYEMTQQICNIHTTEDFYAN